MGKTMLSPIKKMYKLIIAYIITIGLCQGKPVPMIITVPAADLRASPHAAPKNRKGPALSEDMKGSGLGQVSQVLFGEKILAEPTPQAPGWLTITTPEQRIQGETPLQGYIEAHQATVIKKFVPQNIAVVSISATCLLYDKKKYIKKLSLPLGTKLYGSYNPENNNWTFHLTDTMWGTIDDNNVIPLDAYNELSEQELRNSIVATATKFIGTPYVWGGRSRNHGIDCSNLVCIVFATHNIPIPRNSSSQHFAAKKITKGNQLQPGDVIFLTDKKGNRITHVTLYAGDNMLIEAAGSVEGKNYSSAYEYPASKRKKLCVRKISCDEYFNVSIKNIHDGMTVPGGIREGATVYLGSFFN